MVKNLTVRPMHDIITIFFNGTGQASVPEKKEDLEIYSLANLLHRQLTDKTKSLHFPGVGTIHPIRGTLFGTGMDAQIETAIRFVLPKIRTDNHVTLNLFGHSRGAISTLLLAKKLAKIDPALLSINIAMHDPVPGNYLTSSQIDTLHFTLAKQAMDLTSCRNLKKVLCLYTHRPFKGYNPIALAHAPLFPNYPKSSVVTEQIIPGTHSEAQLSIFDSDNRLYFINPGSLIAYQAISRFLIESGTTLHIPAHFYYIHLKKEETTKIERADLARGLIKAYQDAHNENKEATTKLGHGQRGKVISTDPQGSYFNHQHAMLEGEIGQDIQVQFTRQSNHFDVLYPFLFAVVLGSTASSLLLTLANMALIPSILIGVSLMTIYLMPQLFEIKSNTQRQPQH